MDVLMLKLTRVVIIPTPANTELVMFKLSLAWTCKRISQLSNPEAYSAMSTTHVSPLHLFPSIFHAVFNISVVFKMTTFLSLKWLLSYQGKTMTLFPSFTFSDDVYEFKRSTPSLLAGISGPSAPGLYSSIFAPPFELCCRTGCSPFPKWCLFFVTLSLLHILSTLYLSLCPISFYGGTNFLWEWK